jgi:hypothetical protein
MRGVWVPAQTLQLEVVSIRAAMVKEVFILGLLF